MAITLRMLISRWLSLTLILAQTHPSSPCKSMLIHTCDGKSIQHTKTAESRINPQLQSIFSLVLSRHESILISSHDAGAVFVSGVVGAFLMRWGAASLDSMNERGRSDGRYHVIDWFPLFLSFSSQQLPQAFDELTVSAQ